jgi:Bacteriodetes cell division protein (FtsL-like)
MEPMNKPLPTKAMGENKLKIESKSEKRASGGSMFSGLERRMKLETYFEDGFPVKHLPKILFTMVLSLLYISNTHYAEKTTRGINHAQSEVEDLRADFTTLKADVMFGSKQSEVARRVKTIGLKESVKPPFKIIVEEGEY